MAEVCSSVQSRERVIENGSPVFLMSCGGLREG